MRWAAPAIPPTAIALSVSMRNVDQNESPVDRTTAEQPVQRPCREGDDERMTDVTDATACLGPLCRREHRRRRGDESEDDVPVPKTGAAD